MIIWLTNDTKQYTTRYATLSKSLNAAVRNILLATLRCYDSSWTQKREKVQSTQTTANHAVGIVLK
jgi:hypothetical protein